MALLSKFPLFCMFMLWATFLTTTHSTVPAVDYSSLVLNMADCLSFATAGSTTKKPEGTCCSGLKTVLKTDSQCLCEGFKNNAQFRVILNVTKALALPSECHVSAPSVMNIGSVTGGAPVTAVVAASALSPTAIPGARSISIVPNEVSPAIAPVLRSSGSFTLNVFVGFLVLSVALK